MAVNETSRPTTETRDGHELSSVSTSASASANRDNAAALATNQPQAPVNGGAATAVPTGTVQQPLPQPYPQYQVPYAPYPYQQPQQYPYAQAPVLPPYSKSWTVSKLVLTSLTLVFAIIILALACTLFPSEYEDDGVVYYALPFSIASILWNGAELITYAVRARKDAKRGIHPGAHVGLHLCLWIVCVLGVFFTVLIAISTQSIIRDCADDDEYSYYSYCDRYGYRNSPYMNGTYLPIMHAITAFFSLITISHFVLFVLACIDTHKRNMLKPAGIVMPPAPHMGAVYYPPPPQPGVTPYYPYPMPMAPQQVRYAGSPNASSTTEPKTLNPGSGGQQFQPLAGFYAPPPMPQTYQHPTRAAAGPSTEKVAPSTPAAAGQAL